MFNFMSLDEIDKLLDNELYKCELISDLQLSQDEYLQLSNKLIYKMSKINEVETFRCFMEVYRVTFSVWIVNFVIFDYTNALWKSLNENFNNVLNIDFNNSKIIEIISKNFNKVLKSHVMKTFKDIGYINVTPITCHSGIPNHSLGKLFDVIYDSCDNEELSPELIIDDIKYSFRYKVDSKVYRYITEVEEKAKEFLFDVRKLILYIENISDDVLDVEYIKSIFLYIHPRVIEKYFLWKNTNKHKLRSKGKKHYIKPPAIKYDPIDIGVYLDLPNEIIDNGYDEYLEWSIKSNIENKLNEKIIKSKLYYRDGNLESENKLEPLLPAKSYIVCLKYEDVIIKEWMFNGIIDDKEPILKFDNNNTLIKTNKISTKNIRLVLKKDVIINNENLSVVENFIVGNEWSGYKCIDISFGENAKELVYQYKGEEQKIDYKKDRIIKLVGGNTLFNQLRNDKEIPIYSEKLPKIKIELERLKYKENLNCFKIQINNTRAKFNYELELNDNKNFAEDYVELDLSSIKELHNLYGEIEVKIFQGRNLIKILILRYVPFVEIYEIESDMSKWPHEKYGFKERQFIVKSDERIKIKFNNCIVDEKNEFGRNEFLVRVNKSFSIITGRIDIEIYRDKVSFPIFKRVKNISWGFLGSKSGSVDWSNKLETYLVSDIKRDSKKIIFKIDDGVTDKFNISFNLKGKGKTIIQTEEREVVYGKECALDLNIFMDTIGYTNLRTYMLEVVIDNQSKELSRFYCLMIKDKLDMLNIAYEEDILGKSKLSWKSEQPVINDNIQIKIYNITRLWENPIAIAINENNFINQDGKNIIYFNSSIKLEKNSVYFFEMEGMDEGWIEENHDSVVRIIDKSILNYYTQKDTLRAYDFKSAISKISLAKKREDYEELLTEVKTFKVEQYDRNVLKALYSLYFNIDYFVLNSSKEDVKTIKITILRLAKEYITRFNIYEVISELLEIDDEKNVMRILENLGIFNFNISYEYEINSHFRKRIWDIDKERAFKIEIRSGKNSKNMLINEVLEWIGIENNELILKYNDECKKCKMKGTKLCIVKFFKRGCDKRKLNLTSDLIGSAEQYNRLFENYENLRGAKKFENMKWLNESEDTGVKICNRTYVGVMKEWNDKFNIEERKKLNENVKKSFSYIDEIVKREMNNEVFKYMYELFKLRRDIGDNLSNILAYYEGVTILISTLQGYSKLSGELTVKEKRAIQRLEIEFRKYMKNLYIRDTIINELYALGGEKLLWQ